MNRPVSGAEARGQSEARSSVRRGGRKRQLAARDVVIITIVGTLLVLAADWAWSGMSAHFARSDADKRAVHIVGELTFILFYGVGVLGSVVYLIRAGRITWAKVGVVPARLRGLWFGLVAGLAAYTVVGLVDGLVAQILGRDLVDNSRVFADGLEPTWYTAALSVVSSTLIFPLLEELYFRGVLQTWLRGHIPGFAAIAVSALAFAAYHENWDYLPSLAVLGAIAGWVYVKTKSIWPAVIAHGVYNATIDLFGYLSPS